MCDKAGLKVLAGLLLVGTYWMGSSGAWAAAADGARVEATAGATKAQTMEEWITDVKNPTPWWHWGFDQRMREVYANNFITLSKDAVGHEKLFTRQRSRLWNNFTLNEDVKVNTRLVWEWRIWCKSNEGSLANPSSVEWDEALFDHLNVEYNNAFGMPLDLKVGRQDVIFGNGWLVLDGTPLDGSRTIFFDAARATYRLEDYDTTVDLVYIEQESESDQFIEPFNDQDRGLHEQDERGVILYVTNKSLEKTQIDGYYIFKHDELADSPAANFPPFWAHESDIHTLGARTVHSFDDHWQGRAEFAQQMGEQDDATLCAFGFNSRLTYSALDNWNNKLRVGYEYLSGDDPSTGTDEGFDPLWARWPQWSELYIYTYLTETRIAETSNLHRIQFGWDADPTEKIHLCNEYNLLWAAENAGGNPIAGGIAPNGGHSGSGKFRGQLLATKLIYKFTPHLSGHLWGEYFFPGNFYTDDRNDPAVFLRYELMLTF